MWLDSVDLSVFRRDAFEYSNSKSYFPFNPDKGKFKTFDSIEENVHIIIGVT